jgi:hypothetical protein
MTRHKTHKRHYLHKRILSDHINEDTINYMVQVEACELYERMGWMFGSDLIELLEEEMLETKELH